MIVAVPRSTGFPMPTGCRKEAWQTRPSLGPGHACAGFTPLANPTSTRHIGKVASR
jgi:hypothetical protein